MDERLSIAPRQPPRRLILGAAFVLALALSLSPRMTPADAQETKALPGESATAKSAASPRNEPTKDAGAAKGPPAPADKPATPAAVEKVAPVSLPPDKAAADKDAASGSTPPATGKGSTIVVRKGNKTVTITGASDHEFDSVDDFAKTQPGLAFAVVAVVALVFLAPVLAIALIVGYRIKKARMLNETMLKLAEKGIVPPADALQAVAAGSAAGAASVADLSPSAAPLHEQAKALRKRAAWSDLRKGVVMTAIGLGLVIHASIEEREASGVGLVLLFVGIGYLVLWWFEQRPSVPPNDRTGNGRGPGAL